MSFVSPWPRRSSRLINVGNVQVGGGSRISIQSMCTTRTDDIEGTLQQIRELTTAGCEIIRLAVRGTSDADALPEIAANSPIPVIADIHFQPLYVFKAIDAGCAAVRVNPGNIRKFDDKVGEICRAATDAGVSLRIGVNAGSLDERVLAKYNGVASAEALVESAVNEARLFEDVGFHDFKISVKHHDVVTMVKAYQQLATLGDWPLHLGVTEAGPEQAGTIKSASAFGVLLSQGIGDTIRVSLSAPPVKEIAVAKGILQSLGLREKKFEIISCPTCGRVETDVIELANKVQDAFGEVDVPLSVAVMGCIVNGPGEAREADLGVAGGAGKGRIFIKGETVATVDQEEILPKLMEIADKIIAERKEQL